MTNNWIWIDEGVYTASTTPGKIVEFRRTFKLKDIPDHAWIRLSADTRYKLVVNGTRAGLGPTRGTDRFWFYDTLDIAPYLIVGENYLEIRVMRLSTGFAGGFTFARTALPGLTLVGSAGDVNLSTLDGWEGRVLSGLTLPVKGNMDMFLHVSRWERQRVFSVGRLTVGLSRSSRE